MELYEKIFSGVMAFNDYLNMELINNRRIIIPVTVMELKNNMIKVYYTIEEETF